MLVTVITNPSLYSPALIKSLEAQVDLFEFRLDYFEALDLNFIDAFQKKFSRPIIFTLRKSSQGGKFVGTESSRLLMIKRLLTLAPEFFDIESDVDHKFIYEIKKAFPKTKLIGSYHNFNNTPRDLGSVLNGMKHGCFYAYKLATFAKSTLDAFRMLQLVKSERRNLRIAGICMGEYGEITRILAPVVGGYLSYAYMPKETITASGQVSVDELLNVYNYRKLNLKTKVYCLIGNPVKQSFGHVFHNQNFKNKQFNAVYIKLPVLSRDFPKIINLINEFPFSGCSITMPYKEKAASYIKKLRGQVAAGLDSINTMVNKNKKWYGYNTDGISVVNLMEKELSLKGKIVCVFGCGGAAKSIIFCAVQRGAKVFVFNRKLCKARILATEVSCVPMSIKNFTSFTSKVGYDILINATPIGMDGTKRKKIFDYRLLLTHKVVVDLVSSPENTLLLQAAKKKRCIIVSGKDVFIEQALKQYQLWKG